MTGDGDNMKMINPRNQFPYFLRKMQTADLSAVIEIENVAQLHPWSQSSFQSSLDSSHQCYVLENVVSDPNDKATIVAYAVISTAADEAELLNITVSPHSQRQGLGHLLLQYLSDSFDETMTSFFLEVRRSNHQAIALYDAHYFNEVGVRANYYPSNNGTREDAIIMAKDLSL
jgi:[ribosomal protein S18]-alanine N-acetyltransferase